MFVAHGVTEAQTAHFLYFELCICLHRNVCLASLFGWFDVICQLEVPAVSFDLRHVARYLLVSHLSDGPSYICSSNMSKTNVSCKMGKCMCVR